MLNSRTKDKIYAFLSFLAIVSAIGSFVFAVSFLLETNKYIFSVNEKIVKEKTTVVDKAGFEIIKEKLNLKEGKSETAPQAEKIPLAPDSSSEAMDGAEIPEFNIEE